MSAFKPITHVEVRWAPAEGEGLEHLTIRAVDGGYRVASVVIGAAADGREFGLSYEIGIDSQWHVTSVAIRRLDGRTLTAHSPEPGRWLDHDGKPLAAFDGAIDIDCAFTPFTNTLVVRRKTFAIGEAREYTMFYVPSDTLEPITDGQRYTCLAPDRFLYEATDGGFAAKILFDEYGLVADYPGLYRRIA
jgi:hypothetical protein